LIYSIKFVHQTIHSTRNKRNSNKDIPAKRKHRKHKQFFTTVQLIKMMTEQQISLIEKSWDYVVKNVEEAGMVFYGKLFELNPEVRAMFPTEIRPQAGKLIAMISFVVSKIRNLDEVIEDVKQLGKRHNNYKVEDHHYGVVAQALLITLETALGNQWNDEVKEAWVQCYTILSGVMKEGAKEA
jgi:hemoglobin-like flavoprotein